jgi:MFS family permease
MPSPVSVLRAMVVDIQPLRDSAPFRWLFFGQFGSLLSRQLLTVAVPYEVFVRTDSTVLVGLVGLVQVLPLVFFSLVGGVLADALDRRAVLIVTEVLMGLTAVAFLLNVNGPHVWPMFVIVAFNAALNGVESPARQAMVPTLVDDAQVTAAYTLHQSLNQTMQVVGPALGGLLIATLGLQSSYIIAAVGAGITAVALVPIGRRAAAAGGSSLSISAAVDGWRYLRKVPILQQTMLIDLNAMVFGMPRALFPAIGTQVLGGTAATVGLLFAAPGAGAMIGALTAGWVPRVQRQGRAIVLAVVGWGVAIAIFGLSRNLALCLVLLALAGGADVVSNIFRNTILQASTPDHLRGRVFAFKSALSGAGPRLGDMEAGTFAGVATPAIAVTTGGLVSVAGALLIAFLGKDLWRQNITDPTPALDAEERL